MATGDPSFVRLEAAWKPILKEEGQPRKVVPKLFAENMASRSVLPNRLPKVVLINSPGCRVGVYTRDFTIVIFRRCVWNRDLNLKTRYTTCNKQY